MRIRFQSLATENFLDRNYLWYLLAKDRDSLTSTDRYDLELCRRNFKVTSAILKTTKILWGKIANFIIWAREVEEAIKDGKKSSNPISYIHVGGTPDE